MEVFSCLLGSCIGLLVLSVSPNPKNTSQKALLAYEGLFPQRLHSRYFGWATIPLRSNGYDDPTSFGYAATPAISDRPSAVYRGSPGGSTIEPGSVGSSGNDRVHGSAASANPAAQSPSDADWRATAPVRDSEVDRYRSAQEHINASTTRKRVRRVDIRAFTEIQPADPADTDLDGFKRGGLAKTIGNEDIRLTGFELRMFEEARIAVLANDEAGAWKMVAACQEIDGLESPGLSAWAQIPAGRAQFPEPLETPPEPGLDSNCSHGLGGSSWVENALLSYVSVTFRNAQGNFLTSPGLTPIISHCLDGSFWIGNVLLCTGGKIAGTSQALSWNHRCHCLGEDFRHLTRTIGPVFPSLMLLVHSCPNQSK
ncbi:hypothetical protein B0H14DRAFT_2587012 [Mycena olivaceomarginata]|nr:hypothetical protein B0H14DRAFT_2587012 [Mycena olivaceomarginata]